MSNVDGSAGETRPRDSETLDRRARLLLAWQKQRPTLPRLPTPDLMALTLEQYAAYLDSRPDLAWPAPPEIRRAKARPYLIRLPEVRVVSWNVYGTLLAIGGGELVFEHPQNFIMDLALDKTVREFKMWGAMTRKPGQPSEYLGQMYA